MAERFLYLPAVFYAAALALGLQTLARHYARTVPVLTSVLLGLFLVMTFGQSRLYQNWFFNLRDAIARVPEESYLHNTLGAAYLQAGMRGPAEKQFLWSYRDNPAYPETLTYLGLLKHSEGNPGAARDYFEQALRLNPAYAGAHYNLGRLLLGQGRWEEAGRELKRAEELDPSSPAPRFGLALLALERKDLAGAKKGLDSALQVSGGHLPSLKLRARLAVEEGDFKTAEGLILRLEKLSPRDPELKQLRELMAR